MTCLHAAGLSRLWPVEESLFLLLCSLWGGRGQGEIPPHTAVEMPCAAGRAGLSLLNGGDRGAGPVRTPGMWLGGASPRRVGCSLDSPRQEGPRTEESLGLSPSAR